MIKTLTCGIVFYDEVNELKRLIPQLKNELSNYQVEWLFILNHEQLEIRQWIKKWILENISGAICIENPSNNLGFARQLILENASNSYIYMTDPDIDLKPQSLVKLIQQAEIEDSGAGRSFKILGYGGTVINKSTNHFVQVTNDFISTVAKNLPYSFQIQNHLRLSTVDHLPACHLLLKKEDALAVGGFSAFFSKVGEDLDFTHRAFNQNYRFLFLPSSQVDHHQNLSFEKWLYKIFLFGKIQIPVQKLNYSKGLRPYRLMPLCFLVLLGASAFFFYIQLLILVIAILALSLLYPAILGFTLTVLSYAFGEFFETIYPTEELKNEQELLEITKDLSARVQKANM